MKPAVLGWLQACNKGWLGDERKGARTGNVFAATLKDMNVKKSYLGSV